MMFKTTTKKGKTRAWDRHTYRKTWANIIEQAAEKHPAVKGMILRDLRPTFRTFLTNAGVPEPTIRVLMGHTLDVSQGYHHPDWENKKAAIMKLPIPPAPEKVAAGVAVNAS